MGDNLTSLERLPPPLLLHAEQVCRRFEAAWKAGERPRLEDYLAAEPGPVARVLLRELVLVEMEFRTRAGEAPGLEEYRQRFPDLDAAWLDRACAASQEKQEARRAVPKQPLPGEPTGPDHAGPVSPKGTEGRLRFALALDPSSQPVVEVRRLLLNRLTILILIIGAFYLVHTGLSLLGVFRWPSVPSRDWLPLGMSTLIVATAGVLTLILWRGRPLSLRAMRSLEVLLFAMLAGFAAWYMVRELRSDWFREAINAGGIGTVLVARAHGLNWFALIVIYGLFIPNTWRRCAALAGVLALIPIAVAVGLSALDSRLERQGMLTYLVDLGPWLATAVALAVHGSYRLTLLQEQAREARKLGHYQLKRRLGAGGMGEVYLAEHVLLRRPCAVKVIRPERAGDPQHLRRFEREVQATAALTHPNTVEIYDYGHTADGTFYYAMEFLPGLTLEQLVGRHGPLPPGRAVHLLRQVCEALREAHAAGLVHRDVKPGNIIVCARGGRHDVAKLLDFGLARAHGLGEDGGRLTQQGTLLGTPAYMSPEQAAGREELDARSDLYSLGAVAYFLLTGRPPFVRDSAVQTLAAHLGESVVAPGRLRGDVPEDLQAVVLRCLEKDPRRRFPDAEAVVQALAGCPCAGEWAWREAAAWWEGRAEENHEAARQGEGPGPGARPAGENPRAPAQAARPSRPGESGPG
jgi:serine/threonine-protein kinase